jgi:hypothetical protein
MRKKVSLLLFFILLTVNKVTSFAYDFSPTIESNQPPSGYYVVTSSTTLTNTNGDTVSISQLLDAKKKSVAEEVYQSLAQRDGKGITFTADLEGAAANKTEFLWGKEVSFGDNTSSTSFIVRNGTKSGGVAYNIFVPKGKIVYDDEDVDYINQTYLSNTNDFVTQFKRAVKEGVLAGTIKAGFNIYEPYSDKQLYIDTATKLESGMYVFNNTGNVSYTLSYFYSPLWGKMMAGSVPLTTLAWEPYIDKVGDCLKANSSTKTVEVVIDSGYMDFLQGNAPECESIKETTSSDLIKAKGVEAYRLGNAQYAPLSAINYLLQVIVPTEISRIKPGVYGVNEDAYKIINNIKLSIATNYVYLGSESSVDSTTNDTTTTEGTTEGATSTETASTDIKYTKDGSFADYNIDRSRLALYKIVQSNGQIAGALIPLRYLEGVYDTSASGSLGLTPTGRYLEFLENYSSNLKWALPSTGMFNLVVPTGGAEGAVVRNYAFENKSVADGSSIMELYKDKSNHTKIGDEPSSVLLQVGFSSNADQGRGFMIIRNNTYLQDSSLIAWLKSSGAQSNALVNATELLKKITGVFENEATYISFEDWQKVQEIKQDLDSKNDDLLIRFTNSLCIFLGFIIAIYAWFLVLAYYFDIFNTFFVDFSLLQLMTFGRYYPIATKEERDFIMRIKGTDVKYVYIHQVILLAVLGSFISLAFINATVVISFAVRVYLYLVGLLGGV